MNNSYCVSLQVARLLKEKGFKEPCECFYQSKYEDDADEDCFRIADSVCFVNRDEDTIRFAAPTFKQAKSWLKSNHNISVDCIGTMLFSGHIIWQNSTMRELPQNTEGYGNYEFTDGGYFESMKEAFNDCILYALKTI